MKTGLTAIVAAAAVIGAVLLYASAYVVEEGRQAVVTQFGKPVRFVTEAGLHFKTPFIQEVFLLEKRLLPWDGAPENMQTRDKKRILVDVWVRWRIADVETFFRAVRTEQRGHKILDDLVDSAVRDVVARNNLIDVVRSSNEQLIYESEELEEAARSSEATRDVVTTGRAKMEDAILQVAGANLRKRYGMELSDVHLKRVNYDQRVKDTVYERMRSERLRIAKLFESEAEEEKNRILGRTRRELDQLEGEMKQRAAEIHGQADAEVIQLTAEAYGQSPEFYEFLRRLEVFKKTFGRDTRLILSTDSDIFQLLKDGSGQRSSPPQQLIGQTLSDGPAED